MSRWLCCAIGLVTTLIVVDRARADGFLVIRDTPSISGVYTVPFHRVSMDVKDQVCKVKVEQAFRNPTGRTIEAEYFFPLPEDAAIDNFVMMVDGKEMPGKLLGRDEARRIYEDIVRQKKDPALMEYMGRGLFKTSIFPIPDGKQRDIHISYTHLAKRDANVIEIAYPLGTEKYSAQPLDELVINCRITSSQPIKAVYSATHDVNVTRPSEKTADVSVVQHNVLPRDDFALLYTVSDDDVGISVVSYRPNTSEPGYFMLLASPKVESSTTEVLAKSVIFVLDKSGSMTGNKIEQARNSLQFVLKNLNPGDTFNIVTYDESVTSFALELQKADTATISSAREFVQRISAGGSTNIDGALRTAMEMLKAPEVPAYIIFLTDGLPTAGEQKESVIVDNCANANRVRARLMAFGVGDDVNARLLDKLVARNFGDSHYVRPNEDIEDPISKLYTRLSAPVLSHVTFDFAGIDSTLTYPKYLPDLFKGNQLVVLGRYHQPGTITVRLSGKVGDQDRHYTHSIELDDNKASYAYCFVEKLWAERRVGYLIDEIDRHGKNDELINEIVALSKRYGIMTPYTSFLADDEVRLADRRIQAEQVASSLQILDLEVSGDAGVGQRVAKRARMDKVNLAPAASVGGMQGGSGGGYFAFADTKEGKQEVVKTVLNLGGRTFFKKQGVWIDSQVTEEAKDGATRIVQYSDEYFELVRSLPASLNQYLTIDGQLLLRIGGKVYWIVPDGQEK